MLYNNKNKLLTIINDQIEHPVIIRNITPKNNNTYTTKVDTAIQKNNNIANTSYIVGRKLAWRYMNTTYFVILRPEQLSNLGLSNINIGGTIKKIYTENKNAYNSL